MVQPGALVETPAGFCSMNFVFRDGAGRFYVGTAGHCVGRVGERAKDVNELAFGTVVFDEDGSTDFALIAVDAAHQGAVVPAVRHWGGPTGSTRSLDTNVGDTLAFYGYGTGFDLVEATRHRSGVLVSDNENRYVADMPATFGDSGGPILHHATGKALGIVSSFNLPLSTDAGPTVARIEARLLASGWDVALVTAPYVGGVA